MERLWQIFRGLGIDALTMTHYDLAEKTEEKDITVWKSFLLDPQVSDWITSEIKIMQNAELNKMIQDISSSKSVGQAQLMQALSKINSGVSIKEGPIFIYTYVPLNSEQMQAPNTNILKSDPFSERGPS